MSKKLAPIHPGEILLKEFLNPLGLTAYRVAKDLQIPANRLRAIINEKRNITADTAVLLGHYFGTSADMWMNLQSRYDLRKAEREKASLLKKLPHAARPHAA